MIKVLVADDQELIRHSLKFVLEGKVDIEVTDAVENGREVIQSVRKIRPDVILMDVRMPEMDGVKCTQIIKENYPEIKIIILTTFDDDEYVYNAIKHGASGYLLKGIKMNEVVQAVYTVYNGGSMINTDVASRVLNWFSKMAKADYSMGVDKMKTSELSKTEWKIICQVGYGLSNKEIARKLMLSEGTVRNYLSQSLNKLEFRDRTQLAIWAVQTGLCVNGREEDDV